MGNNNDHQRKKINTTKSIYKYSSRKIQKEGIERIALPKLCQLHILRQERATLIDSSTIVFGNECMRLVNIAFETSHIFPSIMGTCDTISQYLREELLRQHPGKHFHIIIGGNEGFSFAISNYRHFADIKQEQYRVLIFSTKPQKKVKTDTHDANNQMQLQWKSVVIKQMDN